MKKNLLVAALLSTVAVASFAQPPVDKRDKAVNKTPKHEKVMKDAPKNEKSMKGAEKHSQKQHNKKDADTSVTQ